jgi:outer membrane protein assembly factor BamC
VVRSSGESTTVSVLDAQGQPDSSANAQNIVQLLANDLK